MEVAPFIKRLKGAELEVYGDFSFGEEPLARVPGSFRRPASARPRLVQQRLLPALFISPSLIVNQGTAGGYGDLAGR